MKIQVGAVLFAGLAAVFANASTTPRNMSVGSVLRDPGALMVLHTSMMRRLEVTGPPTPLPTSEMTPVTSEARLEGAIQAGESLVLLGADILLSKAIYILSGAPFTLDGSGYALDGAHNHTCVVVDAAANVTLRNITIVHGSSRFGGGVFVSGGSHLYVIHGRIIKNRATQSGGGVFAEKSSKLWFTHTVVQSNNAPTGGGLSLDGARGEFNSSIVSQNLAFSNGGGFYVQDSKLNFHKTTLEANQAWNWGAATYTFRSTVFFFKSAMVANNASGPNSRGGGVYALVSIVSLLDANLLGNRAVFAGGGAWFIHSDCFFNHTQVSSNKADYGAGVVVFDSSSEFYGTSIFNNTAARSGGGLYLAGEIGNISTVKMLSCNVTNNVAYYNGGGLYSIGTVNISLHYATFGQNKAQYGGAISLSSSNLLLQNSLIFENSASLFGGGIHSDNAEFSIVASNLTKNTAFDGGGGGVFSSSGSKGRCEECMVCFNVANMASGGGLAVTSASSMHLVNSYIFGNQALTMTPFLNRTTGPCSVFGDCFFSPNFPSSYDNNDKCSFEVTSDATLVSETFVTELTYDYLSVNGVQFSGTNGPSGMKVYMGDIIEFTSDAALVAQGFEICRTVKVDGGGAQLSAGGILHLLNTSVSENFAASRGGGIFISSGGSLAASETSSITKNAASLWGGGLYAEASTVVFSQSTISDNTIESLQGSAVYLESGTFQGTGLNVAGNFAGFASAAGATCGSSCNAGKYGDCIPAEGAPLCQINCGGCSLCPPGRASDIVGATSLATCKQCGIGQASSALGATKCDVCNPGTFATNSTAAGTGEVQDKPTVEGAKLCAPCPSGFYSDVSYSIVCQECPKGTSSALSSSKCSLCAAAMWQAPNGNCLSCPDDANCQEQRGDLLPAPVEGFWIDTRNLEYFAESNFTLSICPRLTCTGAFPTSACWSPSNITSCNPDEQMCLDGSAGPLCGSCLDGYSFSNSALICEKCPENGISGDSAVDILLLTVCILLGLAVYFGYLKFPAWALGTAPFSWIKHIDNGMLKCAWSTYQIVGAMALGLNIKFPEPFSTMVRSLSVLNLHFVTLDCIIGTHSFYREVLTISITPICLSFVIGVSWKLRVALSEPSARSRIVSQHTSALLLLSYLVLPSCALVQFQSLDCAVLQPSGQSYLQADTNIDCDSSEYKRFRVLVILLVVIYQSIPFVWFWALWSVRDKIDPRDDEGQRLHIKAAVVRRERDHPFEVSPLSFLYEDYLPRFYFFEVVDVYRRIAFISVLRLIEEPIMRAVLGVLLSAIYVVVVRETSPFQSTGTNVLLVVSQWQIFGTYLAALILLTDSLDAIGLSELAIGCLLLATNCVLVTLIGLLAFRRRVAEMSAFRVPLSSGNKWHFFMSHSQKNSQDQCNAMCEVFTKAGFLVWWDMIADDLTSSGMKTGVALSSVYLLFLNRGVLGRPFVLLEFEEALRLEKPIVLVREIDARHGGPNNERGDFVLEDFFGPETPTRIKEYFTSEVVANAVPYFRRSPYREAGLNEILFQAGFSDLVTISPPSPTPDPPPGTRAFFVYAPIGRSSVADLAKRLEARGVSVSAQGLHGPGLDDLWCHENERATLSLEIDEWQIEASREAILEDLSRSSFVVLFLTDNFFVMPLMETDGGFSSSTTAGAAFTDQTAIAWQPRLEIEALVSEAIGRRLPLVLVHATRIEHGAVLDASGNFDFARVCGHQAPAGLNALHEQHEAVPYYSGTVDSGGVCATGGHGPVRSYDYLAEASLDAVVRLAGDTLGWRSASRVRQGRGPGGDDNAASGEYALEHPSMFATGGSFAGIPSWSSSLPQFTGLSLGFLSGPQQRQKKERGLNSGLLDSEQGTEE
jgi:hypothetical protein